MRRTFLLFLTAFLSFSCGNNCKYSDCISSDYELNLALVDQNTNQPMFFKRTGMLKIDSLNVYKLNTGKKLKIETVAYFGNLAQDSLIRIQIDTPEDFVLEYKNHFKDTVRINSRTKQTECCGKITTYESLTFKGELINRTEQLFFVLKN